MFWACEANVKYQTSKNEGAAGRRRGVRFPGRCKICASWLACGGLSVSLGAAAACAGVPDAKLVVIEAETSAVSLLMCSELSRRLSWLGICP